jgi:hypothetical protein
MDAASAWLLETKTPQGPCQKNTLALDISGLVWLGISRGFLEILSKGAGVIEEPTLPAVIVQRSYLYIRAPLPANSYGSSHLNQAPAAHPVLETVSRSPT